VHKNSTAATEDERNRARMRMLMLPTNQSVNETRSTGQHWQQDPDPTLTQHEHNTESSQRNETETFKQEPEIRWYPPATRLKGPRREHSWTEYEHKEKLRSWGGTRFIGDEKPNLAELDQVEWGN
jgi:hypothetical protein